MHLHTRFTFEYIDLKLKKSASLLLEKKVLFYIWLLHFFVCLLSCEESVSEAEVKIKPLSVTHTETPHCIF